METANQTLGDALLRLSEELAERAKELEYGIQPEMIERFGKRGRVETKQDTVYHLRELSQSLRTQVPPLQRELADSNIGLKAAKEAAESAGKSKSAFLAAMSREIRTTLTGIIALSELLARTPLSESQAESLSNMMDSGNLLLNMINDILDLSLIEAGEMRLELADFHLRSVIDNAVQITKAKAAARRNRVNVYFDPQIEPRLVGDAPRLRQIVLNLIGNAVKFTYEGEIDIRVFRIGLNGKRQQLRVEVKDSGIGISAEHLNRLFQPFFQVKQPAHRQSGADSAGLGLSVTKRLVELMGGTIGVMSKLGEGSTFWFELELDQASKTQTRSSQKKAKTALSSAMLEGKDLSMPVLVAEDNDVNRHISVLQLSKLGFGTVWTAANGREAVAMTKRQRLGLILMDSQMPVMSGFEAAAEIRDWERMRGTGERVPIVAVTANAMEGEMERCLASGMDDYIAKPVQVDRLCETIARWLPDVKPGMQGGRKTDDAAGGAACLDLRTIEDIVARPWDEEDLQVLRQIYAIYCETTPEKLVSLRRLFEAGRFREAEETAHDIKSSSLSVGMSGLAEAAAAAERLAGQSVSDGFEELVSQADALYTASCEAVDRLLRAGEGSEARQGLPG